MLTHHQTYATFSLLAGNSQLAGRPNLVSRDDAGRRQT